MVGRSKPQRGQPKSGTKGGVRGPAQRQNRLGLVVASATSLRSNLNGFSPGGPRQRRQELLNFRHLNLRATPRVTIARYESSALARFLRVSAHGISTVALGSDFVGHRQLHLRLPRAIGLFDTCHLAPETFPYVNPSMRKTKRSALIPARLRVLLPAAGVEPKQWLPTIVSATPLLPPSMTSMSLFDHDDIALSEARLRRYHGTILAAHRSSDHGRDTEGFLGCQMTWLWIYRQLLGWIRISSKKSYRHDVKLDASPAAGPTSTTLQYGRYPLVGRTTGCQVMSWRQHHHPALLRMRVVYSDCFVIWTFAPTGQSQTPFNPFAAMTASAPNAGSNFFKPPPSTTGQPPVANPFASAQPAKPNPFQSNASNESTSAFGTASLQGLNQGNNHITPGGFNPPVGPKHTDSSPPKPFGAQSGIKQANGNHGRKLEQHSKSRPAIQNGAHAGIAQTGPKSQTKGPQSELATKINKQLAKDGIKKPEWPADPNALQQKGVMDELRQAHRAYREKVRKSLTKADLIDDPDKRRRLDEALPFKGICEDMCPEWEQIQRIVENGLWGPEGYEENGARVPIPNKMIKRLARSAAGQEAALPMDVRSPAACRRTLDYLIDELIAFDDRLPTYHHFAWDRTRAIRIDLSMQTPSMTPDEMKDEIYCLETIVRFHATSAHLLARSWFMYKDYSEQQEVEQLSKSLMTLKQRYKDCADMGIVCENEAEFLAYYIVFFGWDSSLKETVESWGEEIYGSEAIQTAMCVVEAMQNTYMLHGPLRPETPTELALNAASIFFSIVASPQISYTMACIAEIHFGQVRQSILRTIIRAYSRPKGAPKDITPAFLRRQLRFDTEDDAVAFVELHELEFKVDNGIRYLFVEPRQQLKRPRIKQAFSHDIVERKRNERPFSDVIHETLYEISTAGVGADRDDDSLFVDVPKEASVLAEDTVAADSDLEDTETSATPNLGNNAVSNPFAPVDNSQPSTFDASPKSSIFSAAGTSSEQTKPSPPAPGTSASTIATTSPFTTKPQPNPFGGFATASSAAKLPEAAGAGKRVTFGETSVKYIESHGDNYVNSDNTSASPGLFSFLSNDAGKTTSAIGAPRAGESSWFPSNLAEPSTAAGNKEGQSVLFAPLPTPGTTFNYTKPDKATAEDSARSAAPSLSQPTITDISSPFNIGQASTPFPTKSTLQTITGPNFFASNKGSPTPAPISTPSPSSAGHSAQKPVATGLFPPAVGLPAVPRQQSKKDTLNNFAKWFVCADRGLLEDLEEWAVETILRDVWTNFVDMEEERKRKEEDEKSWAEARKFRTYSLSVTYFYRWLEIFRKRRVVSRIRTEKEKFRQWNTPASVAKRETANMDAKRRNHETVVGLLQEKARRAGGDSKLRHSTGSQDSVEHALLASGIFKGVRDPKAVAREVAMDGADDTSDSPLPSEALYRHESKRREKHGLPPLSRLHQPRVYKEGSKTAMLKAQLTGKDTFSVSTGSFRNSTLSSSFRSSLGFNTSRVTKVRRSRVSDPYWRLKANGLIQMPNGEYLHESLALPMLREGKRFPGLGDYGLPPSTSGSPSASGAGDGLFEDSPPLMLEQARRSRVSPSPSITSNMSSKRKRSSYHAGDIEDEDLAAYRSEASASIRKRVRSNGSISNEPDLLAQMQGLLNDVQAEGKKLER
ncbi:GANP/Nin1/mts3/eIF-3 p25 family protein [Seiridium cupressi]